MPESRKRKTARQAPRSAQTGGPPSGAGNLASETLALTRSSLQLVRDIESRIGLALMYGNEAKAAELQEQYLYLRSASLGLMVAYSQMTGLPDPRNSAPVG